MEKLISRAEDNLKTHLEWVGRFDTRISFVTAIDIAMLGILIEQASDYNKWNAYVTAIFVFTLLSLLASLLFIYLGQYPNVKSKNNSLIFFKTISEKKVDEFIGQFKKVTDEDYLNDLLYQIHINSELITKKFNFLKVSLVCLLLSVVPWMLLLYFLN